jgi:molybdopterin synthase catalytic subunit
MQVTVKLFSYYRQVAGTDRLRLDLVEGTTVADLLDTLSRKLDSPGLNDHSASVLLNQQNAGPETCLKEGDEVLLLPIVGGG